MEKYLFILGRNWRLSLAEIDSFLQQEAYLGRITDFSANVAIVEFDHPKFSNPEKSLEIISELMIKLGSVQKIGKCLDFIEREVFENGFPLNADIADQRALVYSGRRYVDNTLKDIVFELFPKIKNQKFFIANSIYPEAFNDSYYKEVLVSYFLHYVNKFFNTHLREEGAKQAIYYKYPQKNIESGNLNPLFPHHFLRYRLYEPNRVEILYCMTEEGMYVGKTLTVVDSNFQKEMDEERPFKQFRQSIPPKFAKTLISYLGIKHPYKGKKIYDPFCGSGTILQFGQMLGLQVYGSDIIEEQVKGTRQNIQFAANLMETNLSKKNLEENIQVADIANVQDIFPDNYFDGIPTEPVLLPYYREAPSYEELREILDNESIPLYNQLLKKAFRLLKPGARLALVAPIIQTKEGQKIGFPITQLAMKIGFKSIQLLDTSRIDEKENPRFKLQGQNQKSIFDAGSKHISREFFVFVKPRKSKK
ncbi:hypothetical protein NEF87_001479 [Candidatus Lokiarchaeum ossiferum]|uniref:DNA methylase N-4/N-6 domain-containing protein n=1 Tax=Candidatus Lokiarchaeum ossiferum TaxID=2951803 RepID=A0ABY6HRU7_9ARCH|nr:hypothetical protein NEF87_001479 [Candidatus Lokiarchaeum sp. B-35]